MLILYNQEKKIILDQIQLTDIRNLSEADGLCSLFTFKCFPTF